MLQSPAVRGIPDYGLCDVVFDMLERQGSLVDGQHFVPFFIKPDCQILTEVTEADNSELFHFSPLPVMILSSA